MCHNFYHSQLVMWASCGTSYSILCGTSIIHQLMEGRSQQTRIKRQCVTSTHAQSVYRNSYNIFTVKIHQKFSLFSRWQSTKVSIWYVVRTGMALCLCVRWAPTIFNIQYTAGINSIPCDAFFFSCLYVNSLISFFVFGCMSIFKFAWDKLRCLLIHVTVTTKNGAWSYVWQKRSFKVMFELRFTQTQLHQHWKSTGCLNLRVVKNKSRHL